MAATPFSGCQNPVWKNGLPSISSVWLQLSGGSFPLGHFRPFFSGITVISGMDWMLIILGILLVLAGLAGSLLPVLPGPPLAFIGLLLQQWRDPPAFSHRFLWISALLVVGLLALDWIIPVWSTRRWGGSRYGMWGCTLGFILAFWMGPWGIIIGPLAGAFLAEWLAHSDTSRAFSAAWGSFVGFLLGSLMKIIACLLALYYILHSI